MAAELTQQELASLVMDALTHSLSGDSDNAATALQTMGQGTDDHGMYGVCCAIAAAGEHALKKLYGDRAPGSDGMWVVQELQPGAMTADPPNTFATRFLIAYANRDSATALALFDTALRAGGEQYIDSVCALLANVTGLLRLALDQPQT